MRAEEVYQCGKCGLCQAVCPVYQVTRDETKSPRAKVQLIKHLAEQDIQSSPRLRELVATCLMCGACSSFCPSGVEHNGLFMRIRSQMVDSFGEDWRLKIFYRLFSSERQFETATQFAKYGQRLVAGFMKTRIGDIPLSRIPKMNSKPFRKQVPAENAPRGEPKGTVLYFTGCATNYLFDQVGWATVRVLTRLGYRVEIPKGQQCCGLPLFSHGHDHKALGNIQSALDLFNREDVEAVIVDCATCGSALRAEYPRVLANLGQPVEKAMDLAAKVRDVTEFAAGHAELLASEISAGRGRDPLPVTYHSPCHLRNAQKVSAQIESLLQRLPGLGYVRSADWEACCGGGGTFFYEYPEITRKMVHKKIDNAAHTGAELWLTGCPGCRINLSGNLDHDSGLQVRHPMEVVAELLERGDG